MALVCLHISFFYVSLLHILYFHLYIVLHCLTKYSSAYIHDQQIDRLSDGF